MDTYYNEFDPKAVRWLDGLSKRDLISRGRIDGRSIKDVATDDVRGFRRVHFFAGIGGWDYALRLAGWPADRPVWTGSCPCQPYSSAGKGKGHADDRNLWPDMFRLIRECRPITIFGEQVDDAIGYGWLDGISTDLEKEGYAVGSVVLGAHSIGSPQIRQRLYWVANRKGEYRGNIQENNRDGVTRGLRDESCENCSYNCSGESNFDRLACSEGERGFQSNIGRNDEIREDDEEIWRDFQSKPVGYCQVLPWSEFDLIRCLDGNWRRIPREVESSVLALVDGIPDRVDGSWDRSLFPITDQEIVGRNSILKGSGNAIVPQVAAEFISAFLETEQES